MKPIGWFMLGALMALCATSFADVPFIPAPGGVPSGQQVYMASAPYAMSKEQFGAFIEEHVRRAEGQK